MQNRVAAAGGIDIWWVNDVTAFADADVTLTAQESSRAAAFVFDKDRVRFVARRKLLRRVLSAAQGCQDAELELSTSMFGKPMVLSGPLVFNTSSSGDSLLIAVGQGPEIGAIGVDLETLRTMPDALAIAEQFFATDEVQELKTLVGDEQERAFFNCWTRKEAVVKALGLGLSFDLNRFSVTLRTEDPARIRHLDGRSCEWCLHAWSPSPHYAAALVTKVAPNDVRVHRL